MKNHTLPDAKSCLHEQFIRNCNDYGSSLPRLLGALCICFVGDEVLVYQSNDDADVLRLSIQSIAVDVRNCMSLLRPNLSERAKQLLFWAFLASSLLFMVSLVWVFPSMQAHNIQVLTLK
jgi:hypothetical protein